jgi:hypothetical protein
MPNIENRSSLNEQTQNKNTCDVSRKQVEIWIRAGFNPVNGKNGNVFLYILNPDIICQQWHYSHSPISSSGCGLRSMKSEKAKGPKQDSPAKV